MTGRSAIFLDLNGTLGGEGLGDIRDFTFYPFAIPAIKMLNDGGLLAIIVTNQPRIARGMFGYEYFLERIAALKGELKNSEAHLDAVFCCPHLPEDGCSCIKPKPGLLLRAQKDFNLDLSRCYVVGDSGDWDMALASNAGCRGILVRTGLGESSLGEYRYTWADVNPDFIADDVLEAVKWIISDRTKAGPDAK